LLTATEDFITLIPLIFLLVITILGGSVLIWGVFEGGRNSFIILSLEEKFIILLIFFSGLLGVILLEKNLSSFKLYYYYYLINRFLGLRFLRNGLTAVVYNTKSCEYNKNLDLG